MGRIIICSRWSVPVVYLLGVAADYTCSEQKTAAKFFTHAKALCKHWPPEAHLSKMLWIQLFINYVEIPKASFLLFVSLMLVLKVSKPLLFTQWSSHIFWTVVYSSFVFLTRVGMIHNLKTPTCWNYHIFNFIYINYLLLSTLYSLGNYNVCVRERDRDREKSIMIMILSLRNGHNIWSVSTLKSCLHILEISLYIRINIRVS